MKKIQCCSDQMKYFILFFIFTFADGRSLRIEPNFLFVDEDWPVDKPLLISICSDNIDKVHIISGNDDNRFSIVKNNQSCGVLKTNTNFDADQLHSDGTRWQSFSLLFQGSKKNARAGLDIQVVDKNDNKPKFVNWRSEVNVSEKMSVGSVIYRIQTFDPDTGVGGIVRFFANNQKFNIENERCLNSYCHADLVLKSPLDFESNPVEKVSIIARDGASLTKNSNERIGNLTINVVDEQDTPPTFLTTTSEPIRVAENLAIGSKVFQVNAIDGDRAAVKKNEVVYEIVGNSEYFQIDSVTGAVTLKKKLDRELSPRLNLAIMAVEQDDVHMNSEMMVEFIVEDSDDNPPQCSSKQYTAELNRTSKELNLGQVISVFDKDHGKNSQFDIKIGGEYSESFSVKPKKVQGNADLILSVVDFDSLEYVTDPEIILDLILTPRNGSKTEMITKCSIVIQLDSSAPKASLDSFQFKKQLFVVQIMENMPAPQVLANLTETSEHDVVFTIEGDGAALFSVNDESQFVTAETLDAEKARNYTLKITANQNGQIAAAKIQINVLDENDENPMFEKPHYIFNVTEETEATFYVKATDKDSPANSNVTYGIPDPVPDQVSINKKTGRIFVGKIDVEKLGSTLIEFNVTATDNGNPPLKSTAKVRVNVQDQNDNLPFFSKRAYSVILKCGTPMNSTVVKVKAMDMDLTGSKITYELPGEMQKYFQIDALTGIVILTRELPKAKREFHFNVIAKDGGNPPKQAVTRVSIRVEDCVKVTAAMEKFPTTQSPTPTKFTESTPMTTSTAAPEIPKEKKMINASKVFNKLDGAVRVFIPKHLTFDVEENAAFGTKIYKVDIQDEEYDFHFITQDLNQMNLIKMNKSGDLIVADKIDYEKVQFINGSIFARFNRRNLLYATVTIQIIDQNDNKPILRLPKDFVINLPQETEVGYVLDLPYPLAVDHDLSTSFSAIEYRILNEEQSFFMIDKVLSIIQLVKPLSDNVQLHIQAVDNPNGLDHNSVNYTLVVKVVKFLMPSTTPLPLDLTKNIFHSVPDEISVFEDEMIGSVLLVISVDEFKKTAVENNHILNATLPLVAVEVKNSDVVELANESELKLRKSLKGYVNQKLCIQLEAKIDTNSTVPQIFSKSVCFLVKPRPVAPIISFPIQNSIHKFKENTKYESLLTFNATSTILDPKMSALKFGIVETKTDDWKEFTVDSRGVLKAKNVFDFEVKEKYNLQVQVCDFNDSCTVVAFRIQVEDLNDHCPGFHQQMEVFEIPENQPAKTDGTFVGEFTAAEDLDGTVEKRSICYKIETNGDPIFFLPDNRKPVIFVRKSLDREEIAQYNITVVTLDCHFKERDLNCTEAQPKGLPSKLIVINVADVNDNFPKFSKKEYYGKVIERKTKFGAKILQVEATDADLEPRGLHYSMSSAVRTENDVIPKEEAPFHIDSKTGDIVSHVVYSAKVPHSYNFRVVVRDGAEHEDEASVTISVINYNEQVELVFDQTKEMVRKNQNEITKLMFDITSMYFVIDDIDGHGNSSNVLAHFLEKDKLLASAAKALTIFEESKSEQAQHARHELRRKYALQKIVADSTSPDLINSVFNGAVDAYMIMIGSIFAVIFLLLFVLITYLCCHRQSKTTGKLNCAVINQDLIYGSGTTGPPTTLHFPRASNIMGNMTLPTAQCTTTLNRSQRIPQQNPSESRRDELPNSQETIMFDALQSTEL